jgi:signal peptide peptidase SppA
MDKSSLSFLDETPWAILPERLATLDDIFLRHVSGEELDAEEVQARLHGSQRPPDRRVASVGVLPLFGTIFPRANFMTAFFGATDAESFGRQFTGLINDPEINAIVLDVNSPGGQVNGVEELSDLIYSARGRKPVVAVANHLMASAAYFIGSAADELVVTPSSEVGSIGVFSMHVDYSKALEQDGIKVTFISEGKYKVEGNPYEPLAEEAKSAIGLRVKDYYNSFVKSVARNRGVKITAVKNGYGEGRVVGAQQAVDDGMADRIGTLDETIVRLLSTELANSPRAEAASASTLTEEMERQAQELRAMVVSILRKDNK